MKFVSVKKKGYTAIITIDREKTLNALSSKVLKELSGALETVREIEDVYSVIITGGGVKSFVAGADISEMEDMKAKEARAFSETANKTFRAIEEFPRPVIAAVNGYALGGGCELAMSCDIRIASENAVFAQPETGLGVIPGFGGTQRLQRIVGSGFAKEMIFTGRKINAQKALEIGLVTKVVSIDSLIDEALALADEINKNAPIANMLAKSVMVRGAGVDMDSALAIETGAFAECFATKDRKMAMHAFVNKEKKQEFKNK